MEDISEAVRTMDPIDLVTELNDELLSRYPKLIFIMAYATFVGFFAALASIILLILYILSGEIWKAISMILMAAVSIPAFWYAYTQGDFFNDYRLLMAVVNRGLKWDPVPSIPEGENPIERFVTYLLDQDDRFSEIKQKYPEYLQYAAEIEGESGKKHRFDVYFQGDPKFRDFKLPSLHLYIRVIPEVTIEAIDEYKNALEDVLAAEKFHMPSRFFLLQTASPSFSDEVREHVNTALVEYERFYAGDDYSWSSPIEILAEDPSGHYNIGSFYFG